MTEQKPVGRVIGTEDATPLEFWVGVEEGRYLQLDDVVALERTLPGGDTVHIYGMVEQVRARHEGARFDSDVFLIEDGVLPAQVSEAAKVVATRFEPETFVPPRPGQAVRRAVGEDRDKALFFDRMTDRIPVGLSRAGEPIFVNLEFRCVRRCHQDHLRDVPAAQPLHLRCARRQGGEYEGADLQRQG
jgi:DNA helicase HerA-like ATPase